MRLFRSPTVCADRCPTWHLPAKKTYGGLSVRDLKHLIYFENLLQEANNDLVKQAKAEGKRAIGYTCYFMPEVLLDLPGCFSAPPCDRSSRSPLASSASLPRSVCKTFSVHTIISHLLRRTALPGCAAFFRPFCPVFTGFSFYVTCFTNVGFPSCKSFLHSFRHFFKKCQKLQESSYFSSFLWLFYINCN